MSWNLVAALNARLQLEHVDLADAAFAVGVAAVRGAVPRRSLPATAALERRHPAELLVVDQLGNGRMLAAHHAVRVAAQLELAEAQLEGVVDHQTPGGHVADAEQHLDHLVGLQRADHAGQHAQHAALGAARHQSRRRRFAVEAAVAGAVLVIEHRDLALEAEDRSVHVGLAGEHAGVVDQVAGREIVGTVGHHVVLLKQIQGVGRGQRLLDRLDGDGGVEVGQPVRCPLQLRLSHLRGAVQYLALQVGLVDLVELHDADAADAGRGQVQRQRRAEPAGADQQRGAGLEPLLSRDAHVRDQDVAAVARQLGGAQGRGAGAAGDGGYNGDGVAALDGGVLAVLVADVFLVHVHVDEVAQGAVGAEQVLAEVVVGGRQLAQHLTDRALRIDRDRVLVVQERSQRRGDVNGYRHDRYDNNAEPERRQTPPPACATSRDAVCNIAPRDYNPAPWTM